MSQHLITQFINSSYVFKPFTDAKLVNRKLKKYQASNRNNNTSPADIAESRHVLQKIKVSDEKDEKSGSESSVDITV